MPNHRLATRFNKQYYEELFRRAWSPRNVGTNVEDWSSTPTGSTDPKMSEWQHIPIDQSLASNRSR